ncbi:cytotoxic T-lymphocyte protein 4 [Micropterus salmoides]|uniref:cytotoxic T-lymphocyte protein 4 n=1 Tax=Micropterus salmoides TaxID=27706 RepID=UPI0018EDC7D8|nr:cytotoxic T-lymphocyte protein 4 [Micropterus salmoides]
MRYCRMFLIPSVMAWIVLTVVNLPVWSALKVVQPYRVVSTNGTAQVQCFVHPRPSSHQIQPSSDQSLPYPYADPEELRVILLKGLHGTQQFCSSILSFKEQKETGVEKEGEVQCSAQMREGAVEVTVSGLKPTHTDIYRCEIEVFYPPPYLRIPGNGTLLHVLESSDCPVQGTQRQIADQGEKESEERMAPWNISVPVFILALLVIFVVLIIIYLQALQCIRGRREIVRPVPGVHHKVDPAAFSC